MDIADRQIKHNKDIEQRIKKLIHGVVERGQSVNVQDLHGQAALHLVAQYWGEERWPVEPDVLTLEDALGRPLDSVTALAMTKLFLAKGARVNHRDDRYRTPLHYAVEYYNCSMAITLLKCGAKARTFDIDGRTPLHTTKSALMAEILLKFGAPVNDEDGYGRTPLKFANTSDCLKLAQILIKYGSSVNCKDDCLITPLHFAKSGRIAELLLAHGTAVDARTKWDWTPLHYASESDLHDVMRVLVKFGANVDAKDMEGKTALHRCVISSSTGRAKETIRLLMDLGVNVNAEDDEGYTAIQRAVQSGSEEMVLALLEHNVQVFPETARHGSTRTDYYGKIPKRTFRLIDASIKLKAARLICNRHNLIALARGPGRDYFSTSSKYSDLGANENELKLDCEAEVERLKNHMLTDTWSLHDFMMTDNFVCVFSRSLLDPLRMIDYRKIYPAYGTYLTIKFKELNLVVSAKESFSTLIEYGTTNVRSLPEELVVKILVQLDWADMKKLISCSNSVVQAICDNEA